VWITDSVVGVENSADDPLDNVGDEYENVPEVVKLARCGRKSLEIFSWRVFLFFAILVA
jgi:hypothetical protein